MMWDILEMEDTPLLKMPEVTREQERSFSGITCWQGAT